MLFNSIEFVFFLPTVFLLYWYVFRRTIRMQNTFLLVASYVFYGWWDWRFLSLIVISSTVDYVVGLSLAGSKREAWRRFFLGVSLVTNIGLLGAFKYWDFFAESFAELISAFGLQANPWTLRVILPVGISFYTFQTLSYTIDVYRGKMEPTKDVVSFFAYVSFFPQLVAGPIERAAHLLPQFLEGRNLSGNRITTGVQHIIWGLFKKIAVADQCARLVDLVFENPTVQPAPMLVLGTVFFAFQIYGDFSGYSDIAIGTAKLFGFDLMTNFRVPYFSRDIAEFWRRWHISLSTWFRDYLYIPLGGSKCSRVKAVRNTFVIFLVSGLWHGADWSFVAWGGLNALYFLPLLLSGQNRKHLGAASEGRIIPTPGDMVRIIFTFALVCFGWIFFRASSIGEALVYIRGIVWPHSFAFDAVIPWLGLLVPVGMMVGIEWLWRERTVPAPLSEAPYIAKWVFYYAVGIAILLSVQFQPQQFIYFQF
mgnify:CR=1 FL=1